MMDAVASLRRRLTTAVEVQTLGYAPLSLSDDEDRIGNDGEGGYEMESVGEFSRGAWGGERRERGRPRFRPRPRSGPDTGDGGGDLWPRYTPLYSNIKVQRRKRRDALGSSERAAPCIKLCFVVSLFGSLFLSWIGFTLEAGSPYMLVTESKETKLGLSRSVFCGAAMYFVCACVAGFFWYRISFGPRVMPTLGRDPRDDVLGSIVADDFMSGFDVLNQSVASLR